MQVLSERPGIGERVPRMTLSIRPLTLREANAYVAFHHRHNKPVVGHRFSIGVSDGGCFTA